jgi:hypothetical protein
MGNFLAEFLVTALLSNHDHRPPIVDYKSFRRSALQVRLHQTFNICLVSLYKGQKCPKKAGKDRKITRAQSYVRIHKLGKLAENKFVLRLVLGIL